MSLPEPTIHVADHGQTSNAPSTLLNPFAAVNNYTTSSASQTNLLGPVGPVSSSSVPVSSDVNPTESLNMPNQHPVQAPATRSFEHPETPLLNNAPETEPTVVPENQASEEVVSPPEALAAPTPVAAERAEIRDTAWNELKRLMDIMIKTGAATFAPLESARDDMDRCVKVFEAVSESRKDYNKLKAELQRTLNQLCDFFGEDASLSQIPSIVSLAKGIEAEILFVIRKLNRTKAEGFTGATKDQQEIAECQSRVQAMLNRLQLNADLKTWKTVDEIATETRLTRLPIAEEAKHRSAESNNLRRVACTPNTRVGVLEDLKNWADDNSSEKIYWLNGMAGTGKTTITYSFCEQLKASERLAASFYCSRQLPSCRNVNRIVPTISYQLALFSRPFRHAVSGVLQTLDIHNQPLLDQFESLVAQPLRAIDHTLPFDLVIVIDALDECEDSEGVGQILEVLLSHTQTLPVKVFVASRPDTRIIDRLRAEAGCHASKELRLHELDSTIVHSDITLYLRSKLSAYKDVTEDDIRLLAMKSGVLFIYAATVVRYIQSGRDPRGAKRLKHVLTSYRNGTSVTDGERDIDQLYTTILKSVIDDPDLTNEDQAQTKLILWTVICAQEPLSVHALAGLLNLDEETIVGPALRALSSVFQISDETGVVTTLHASFPDYLLNLKRSGDFYCDSAHTHAQILEQCFRQIKSTRVPFNICDLKSSYMLDDEVPEMESQIKREISEVLLYSCRYWGAHIRLGTHSNKQDATLFAFLSTRLLLWMEIMNLRKCIHDGAGLLYDVREWYESKLETSQAVRELLRDAWEFVSGFSSNLVLSSTAHIYVSHLSFWPDDRPVSKTYCSKAAKIITATSTALKGKQKAAIQVINAGAGAYCFERSAGTRIVVGYASGIVKVWDSRTGKPVGEPLHGHTRSVNSVGYSPDGAYIVSGSDDNTVRIWDARTGQPVGEPLHGHTRSVNSVGYSPDGAYIVSGSDDNTVRIWDALTGQPVGEPLHGHTRSVNSVGYSPDGAYIVSGSDDNTVRIWDALTGQPVGEPLHGHTRSVNSVGYSPDGAYIVSGSDDNTVRIWDALTGQPVGEPLHGHTGSVNSVGYSPDGAYIVSGSDDNTVRIWDALTGQPVGEPLHGHTGSVNSVGYSPDGAYIVSGSDDNTVRIWDALTGQPVGEPLHGHTGSVNSVGYSPDGAYIVSGSDDNTVRIWDALTGQPVGEPLHGHTRSVNSVGYSPDGAYIVSGSYDNTVRIWDARTGQPVERLAENYFAPVSHTARSPDGASSVTGSGKNIIIERSQSHIIPTTRISLHQGSSISETPIPPHEEAPHICNSSCEVRGPHRPWSLNKDGWVILHDRKRLAWIPAELRHQLLMPNQMVLISTRGFLQLEFHSDGVDKVGDNWAQYFKPQLRDMPA
ncbi:Notchless protein [Ceratobasidium sp. AG-Ba]|nr:Notchless protein [Ceratobasidium sp. AG-Ba]